MVSLFPHPASFRSHLAVGTLAFGCILPTTGRIRDFHPLETCAARRTKIKRLQSSHLRDCPAASLCYALSAPFGAFKVCRYDFIS